MRKASTQGQDCGEASVFLRCITVACPAIVFCVVRLGSNATRVCTQKRGTPSGCPRAVCTLYLCPIFLLYVYTLSPSLPLSLPRGQPIGYCGNMYNPRLAEKKGIDRPIAPVGAMVRPVRGAGVSGLRLRHAFREYVPRPPFYACPIVWLCQIRGLMEADGNFELEKRLPMPFLIREHARKFQWGCSDGTVWRRR